MIYEQQKMPCHDCHVSAHARTFFFFFFFHHRPSGGNNLVRQPRTSTGYPPPHPQNPRDGTGFAQNLSRRIPRTSDPVVSSAAGPPANRKRESEAERGMRERLLIPAFQGFKPHAREKGQIANHRHRRHVDTWLNFLVFVLR